MLIIMTGLPGTGKSTLAQAIANALDAIVLDKDRVRAALFPTDAIEYSTAQDDFCVDVMLQTDAYLCKREPARPIILDGRTFSRRYQVEVVVEAAKQMQTPFKLIECVCRDATAFARLAHDAETGVHPAQNRDAALYHAVKARFEPITIPHLTVDTDDPLDVCLDACLRYLRGSQVAS